MATGSECLGGLFIFSGLASIICELEVERQHERHSVKVVQWGSPDVSCVPLQAPTSAHLLSPSFLCQSFP